MATTSPVPTIRASVGDVLGTVHVHRTTSALSRTTANLDVVNKVTFHRWNQAFLASINWKMLSIMASLLGVSAQRTTLSMPSFSNHFRMGSVLLW